MIVPARVPDSFGREADASKTFLRYELELRYVAPWPHAAAFRTEDLRGARRGGAFISTAVDDGAVVVNTHQDGGSRGKPRTSLARDRTTTTLGATTNVDDPTIFAAKAEMLGLRTLALAWRCPRATTSRRTFVHRDAGGPSGEPRREEIRQALASTPSPPNVPVVPVQALEAWLLHDAVGVSRRRRRTFEQVRAYLLEQLDPGDDRLGQVPSWRALADDITAALQAIA